MPSPRLPSQGPIQRTLNVQGRQPTEGERKRHPGTDLTWTTPRNGMPQFRPYVWGGEDTTAREAEVAAMVAAARTRAAQRIADVDAYLSGGAA